MENVPQVHSVDNTPDFNKWQIELTKLGYKNYWEDLIATDYEIPQTRNRCFMVSILGDYNYTFPKPIPLEKKLKDMLEDNVDEKYFLSDKMIEFFKHNEEKQKEKGNGFRFNVSDGNVIAKTITTLAGNRMDDNFIKIPKVLGGIGEKDSNNNTQWKQQNRIYDNNVSIAVTTCFNPNYLDNDLRIRKLTPREAFRLMGVKDEDFEKVKVNQSDSSLYHLAGDSLITTIMMALFGQMMDINWVDKYKSEEWWNNE
jgi:DNA (cytosine-5)-methyltransferase 1